MERGHSGCFATRELHRVRAELDRTRDELRSMKARYRSLRTKHAVAEEQVYKEQLRWIALSSDNRLLRRRMHRRYNEYGSILDKATELLRYNRSYIQMLEQQRNYWMNRQLLRNARQDRTMESSPPHSIGHSIAVLESHCDRRHVNRMLTHIYVKPEDNTCPVCRNAIERTQGLVLLGCTHWFCKRCWDTWKTTLRSREQVPTCPLCREGSTNHPSELNFLRVQTPSP